MDQACYSLHEVKNRNTSSHSGEIVPANRSSLSPYKGIWASELKNSSDLIQFEKKLLLSGRKSIQYRDHEFIDLTSNSSLHAKPRKEELIAPCSTKKRKVLISESDQMQCVKKISEIASDAESSQPSSFIPITNKVKHEKPQISDSGSRIIAQGSAPSKVDGTTYRIEAEIQSEKSKGSHSSAPPCGGEETKGSAFLIQVIYSFQYEKHICCVTNNSVPSTFAMVLYVSYVYESWYHCLLSTSSDFETCCVTGSRKT